MSRRRCCSSMLRSTGPLVARASSDTLEQPLLSARASLLSCCFTLLHAAHACLSCIACTATPNAVHPQFSSGPDAHGHARWLYSRPSLAGFIRGELHPHRFRRESRSNARPQSPSRGVRATDLTTLTAHPRPCTAQVSFQACIAWTIG